MSFKIYTAITSSLTLEMFIICGCNLSLLENEGLSYACIIYYSVPVRQTFREFVNGCTIRHVSVFSFIFYITFCLIIKTSLIICFHIYKN